VFLRSVRLRGFKSFPDPVEVRLEPGVAVVIGPNGSGKSNVSDAIVWAAGSLSPSELRAEKPDDVLFGGSAGRPSAEHCEVELLFDNSAGDGPLPFSELSIARRLTRGGEGQYLVNRAGVRRTDVVELLADVGLGSGMHSLIGQGRVEEVLGSGAARRRELVEEAAGLGRFKRRRHRAELKLARVAVQVERARDVEAEVRSRLRPLALQATAAERAERLAGEIESLRARIAELDLAACDERLAEAEERRAAAALARRRCDERLEALLRERDRAEEELADAAGLREAATAALYRLRSAAERLEVRRESASGLLAERLVQAEDERESGDAVPELGVLERDADAAAAHARAAVDREACVRAAATAAAALAGCERQVRSGAEERLAEVVARRAELDAGRRRAGEERERSADTLGRFRAASERLAVRREEADAGLAGLREELAEAERVARLPGPSREALERAADEASAAAREAVGAAETLRERIALGRERLAALERSLAEREGLPPAARALAEAGERLAVDGLEVAPGAERAVAAALAWRAAAVVAPDPARALALLEQARTAGLGPLTVLLGDRAHDAVRETTVVPKESLLAAREPAVTPEGHGYDPAAGALWFAGETAESLLLELEARRKALAADLAALERELPAVERRAADAVERARVAAEAPAAAPKRPRTLAPELLTMLVALTARLAGALAGSAEVARTLGETAARAAEAPSAHLEELDEELSRLARAEAGVRGEAEDAREREARAELTLARLGVEPSASSSEERTRAELEAGLAAATAALARAEGTLARAREDARLAADAVTASARVHGRRGDPRALARLAGAAERLDAVLAVGVELAARLDAPLRARVDAGALRSGELAAELRRLGAAEAEARRAAGGAAERSAAIEVELARVGADAEEARRRLETAGANPAEGDDADALAERATRLESRREALGRVNPLAKEEYEREKERLEELAGQRADLEQSLAELERLRAELTETVEQRFAATFATVAEHFEEVAAALFPGGEGRLRLADPGEDEDEPGIEVELRPAGKRITRLSLLSGGEKALGAISFLFALFLARPCPFYLLDEVEAALDDTNIGRFVELLRRYADRAQFIVITHQKRTMEAADVLYGVTMGESGVSEVVSRRLPQEERAAAGAA
jgi:chromosome segregation protein